LGQGIGAHIRAGSTFGQEVYPENGIALHLQDEASIWRSVQAKRGQDEPHRIGGRSRSKDFLRYGGFNPAFSAVMAAYSAVTTVLFLN
jgi:hypothetical protein